MNRRGNGLSADAYDRLVDLAPHLADGVLTALGEAGVAAYVTSRAVPPPDAPAEPAVPADPAGLDEIDPARGDRLDRLYVDAAMKPTAEGILREHLTRLRDVHATAEAGQAPEPDTGSGDPPGGSPAGDPLDGGPAADELLGSRPGDTGTGTAERDEDAIWAEIVASFDDAPQGDATPWPEEENLDERGRDKAYEDDDRLGGLPLARVIKSADPDEVEPLDEDNEGHFVPPPPPPLPSTDPLTKAAWLALVGGPIYLLITVILNWDVPGWAAFLAVAAFIGGFVTLVLRMGDEPRGPDDGAVV